MELVPRTSARKGPQDSFLRSSHAASIFLQGDEDQLAFLKEEVNDDERNMIT